MDVYFSGVVRNDTFQIIEDRMIDCRLLSCHEDYMGRNLKWVAHNLECDNTLAGHMTRIGRTMDDIRARDRKFEEKYPGIEMDTVAVLRRVDEATRSRTRLPRKLMLDSGAFTAWNKGHVTTIDEVIPRYAAMLEATDDAFESILLINLDVIPGSVGVDPTLAEIAEAVDRSQKNHDVLCRKFGRERVLPVFHQGEDFAYLDTLADENEYICISPRNDVHESARVAWCALTAKRIGDRCKFHGLAVSGIEMLRSIKWTSGDAASWMLTAGYGKLEVAVLPSEHIHGRGMFKIVGVTEAKNEVLSTDIILLAERRLADLGLTLEDCRKDYRWREVANVHSRNLLEDVFRQSPKRRAQEALF